MTSSSTRAAVVPRGTLSGVTPATRVELGSGSWGRCGDAAIRPDADTEEILTEVTAQARAAGTAQGYAHGWAEGRRAADEQARTLLTEMTARLAAEADQRRAEHRQAVGALLEAAELLRQSAVEVCQAVEHQATTLAFGLVEAILDRELQVATDPGADAVRRALALLPEEPVVTVRLHPEDLAVMAQESCPHGARLLADPSLGRGDAVVETESSVIDASVRNAVARIRAVWQ